ncbi:MULTISPECIES: GNAT family N-acetyltransferase [unclassified Bacteroides]|jgi:predicted N-acetyltransferase YhbS|uniref:GNAT family N-acetyltransferase n=1 Tax=unclassified Bacteroides TaxID=2646097 RepID=UPI000E8C04EA|nr:MULTISPECIES: N-acetyltransferase [unclassified Bacteroides]RGN46340.1 N-acetyltransferase [Bacteroides sp. OM05-12]RHR74766.1 N-acetyltransferase [Bacteroides sp. AF16-49]
MDIELRREQSSDYSETENVTREAFWNHYSPACSEHYLLHIMRDCPAFVPELDVVAVCDGKIVGNVVYMKSVIRADNGNSYEVLSLGPISVLPEYQRKGIGVRMIEYTRDIARRMGFAAILLCGDPDYYSRQGFLSAETFGIRTEDDMYADALQVCPLSERAMSGMKGRYVEDSIYQIDESVASDFDKHFPPKEIIVGTPSQKRFDEIVVKRRKA